MNEQNRSNNKLRLASCSSHKTFILPIRVYYEDTDAGGVVYHSTYINFFERARTELMRQIGYELDELAEQERILFIVRALCCDYLQAARFNDELFVSAEIIKASKTRIEFEQKIMKAAPPDHPKDEACITLAKGHITVVCVNRDKFKAVRIPAAIMENINSVI